MAKRWNFTRNAKNWLEEKIKIEMQTAAPIADRKWELLI